MKPSGFVEDLHSALMWVEGTDDTTAHEVAETVLGHLIAKLRGDAGMPVRSTEQWEIYFADAIARAIEDLWWLGGMVREDEAVRAIAEHLENGDDE